MNKISKMIALLGIFVCSAAFCQNIVWHDPIEEGAEVHGQGWNELRHTYNRLPDKAQSGVSEGLWKLSRHSAGLSFIFKSDAPEIQVRYSVTGGLSMFHMPSTGVSGIDLYAKGCDGVKRWCTPNFPPKFSEKEILYKYLKTDYYGGDHYEYQMFLPLYNGVSKLEIGVPEGSELEFLPVSEEKPIVIYGTSIAQGACASRPGNAFTNIVERHMDCPVVNLGFSGSGKLEPEMFRLLSQIDAKMYIIDCMPNMMLISDKVYERIVDGIRILREKNDCPVLLVEFSGFKSEISSKITEEKYRTNEGLKKAYDYLKQKGEKGIYYLSTEELGMKSDGMVEGTHQNDYGMYIIANAYEKKIREILYGRNRNKGSRRNRRN